ncbi:protein of unknown function [Aminobacter niigataensis]|nr:protein of unknown function [Aminobacter niigataensis]
MMKVARSRRLAVRRKRDGDLQLRTPKPRQWNLARYACVVVTLGGQPARRTVALSMVNKTSLNQAWERP